MAGLLALGVGGGARAQEQPKAQAGDAAPTVPAGESAQPLSLRYRFIEKYAATEKDRLGTPELMVEYQVGSIETIRREREKTKGAPELLEGTTTTVYTERTMKIGRAGEVLDAIRRYDVYRGDKVTQAALGGVTPLRGLTLWYHPRAGLDPELISMTPTRSIRQSEYDAVKNQVFFPRLTGILPPRPVRVADSWAISRPAARALLANVPDVGDYQFEGTLLKIDKSADGLTLTATIDLSGTMAFELGVGGVRARISFVFESLLAVPTTPTGESSGRPARGGAARDPEVVDARGYIDRVIMRLRKTVPIDAEGRLQEVWTGDLRLDRRQAGRPGGPEATLALQEKPVADVTNSWILCDDPQGRFNLRHPQELALLDPFQTGEMHLVCRRPNGSTDFVQIVPAPRRTGTAPERSKSDPQAFVHELKATFNREGHQLVDGPVGWLPDKDWAPLNRRVYRMETAIKPDPQAAAVRGAARFYLDAYLVLFSRGDSFQVLATTDREDHVAFSNQVEAMIKTIELGPSIPGIAGAAEAPEPPASDRLPAAPAVPGRPVSPPIPREDQSP
jgi:hypothetical protein